MLFVSSCTSATLKQHATLEQHDTSAICYLLGKWK